MKLELKQDLIIQNHSLLLHHHHLYYLNKLKIRIFISFFFNLNKRKITKIIGIIININNIINIIIFIINKLK